MRIDTITHNMYKRKLPTICNGGGGSGGDGGGSGNDVYNLFNTLLRQSKCVY